jgi:Cdc6-like AAA superfamily ATPase
VAFRVTKVKDILWSIHAFDDLVLPPEQKELVSSLIDDYKGDGPTSLDASPGPSSFNDLVQGKGQGLVINLFGKPGVGKTLTVEAICDRMIWSSSGAK